MGKDDSSPEQAPGASSEKATQPGPPDKAPPHRQLLRSQKRALKGIQEHFTHDHSVVINGKIGVGKTLVAREAAKWLQTIHPGLKTLEIHADAWTNFEGGFQALARKAKASFGSAPPFLRHDPYEESGRRMRLATRRENLEQFEKWFEDESQMWCVIVDRADNEEVLFGSKGNAAMDERGIADYLPQGKNVFHVFTTRTTWTTREFETLRHSFTRFHYVRLESSRMRDAITMLQGHGKFSHSGYSSIWRVHALNFNPLAIREIIDSRKRTLWELSDTRMDYLHKIWLRKKPADPDLAAVLQVLEVTEASAFDLLALLCCFHHRDIPLCLVAARSGASPSTLETDKDEEFGILRRLHLITTSYTYCDVEFGCEVFQRGLEILPGIEAFVLWYLETSGRLEKHRALFLARLAKAFDSHSKDLEAVTPGFRHLRLVPHGQNAFGLFPEGKDARDDWESVIYNTGRCIQENQLPVGNMFPMMEEVAYIRNSSLESDPESPLESDPESPLEWDTKSRLELAHDKTLSTLNVLVRLLRENGKNQWQSKVSEQMVLAKERNLGHSPSQKETSSDKEQSAGEKWILENAIEQFGRLLNELSMSPLIVGKRKPLSSSMSDAACLVEEMIELQYRTYIELGSETAQKLYRLAMLLSTYETLPQVERLLVRAISLSENTLGATDSLTVTCRAALVSTFLKYRKWWKAQKISLGIVEAMRETLGEEHPDTLSIRMEHAMTSVGQQQWEEADALLRRLVRDNERVFDESHHGTLATMTQLGRLLNNCAWWDEAEYILIDVIKRSSTSLRRDDPDVIWSMARLASVYALGDQARWTEFEVAVKQIMDAEAWKKGKIHPEILEALIRLAFKIRKYGRREHSVVMLSECIKVLEGAFDNGDPTLRKSPSSLLLWEKGDPEGFAKQEDVGILGRPATTGVPSLWQRWVTYFSPPAAGYERLYFRCGCGELLSMDLREIVPGGIDRLRQRLERSAANVRSRAVTTGSSSSEHPTVPPPAHLSGFTPSAFGAYSGIVDSGVGAAGSSLQAQTPGQPTVRTAAQLQQPQTSCARYLLLCIRSDLMVLVQISVGMLTNDEQMFRRIREEYEAARRNNPWHVSIPSPKWLSKFWHRFVASLPDIPRVAALFKLIKKAWTGCLYQVSNGDFVQFTLVPIRLRLSPRNFKTKQLPPQKEIEELRYVYEPWVIEVEYYDIPLNHLMKPGQHLDDFWLTTFPTKLREPLVRRGGVSGREPCVGWGIRINEKVSEMYILQLLSIAVVPVSVATILYGKFVASWGTDLGQFLFAILAVWLPFLWQALAQGSDDNAGG